MSRLLGRVDYGRFGRAVAVCRLAGSGKWIVVKGICLGLCGTIKSTWWLTSGMGAVGWAGARASM